MQRPDDTEATVGPFADLDQIERFIELVPLPVTVLSDTGMSLLLNRVYCETLGHDAETLLSRTLAEALHPDDVEKARELIEHSIVHGRASADLRLMHADGRALMINWNLHHDPNLGLIVATASDRTSERQRLADAQKRARTDALTGLLSRAGLMEALHAKHRAHPEGDVVVALFDVDGFKAINDTLGHQAGDRVLTVVARRLIAVAADGAELGRLGGDEFVAVSSSMSAPELARSIQSAFTTPVEVEGRLVEVAASIGVCRSTGAESVDDLLRNADIAVYEAKRLGGRRWLPASNTLIEAWHATRRTEEDLAKALEAGRFVPWFQPIVDPIDGRVDCYEALMRWVEPDGSVRPAGTFLDAAVASGLLPTISSGVRREAIQIAGGHGAMGLSVNVSADELLAAGFTAELRALLEVAGLPAERVVIEVTEQTALRDIDRAAAVLSRLRAAGFIVALDDFGAGYSSLTYLTQLPIDVVKLDAGFLRAASEGKWGRTILRAISDFLSRVDIVSVIEGVEDEACHRLVLDLGIDRAQGWYYGVPMSVVDLPSARTVLPR